MWLRNIAGCTERISKMGNKQIEFNGITIELKDDFIRVYNGCGEYMDASRGRIQFDTDAIDCIVVFKNGEVIRIIKDIKKHKKHSRRHL